MDPEGVDTQLQQAGQYKQSKWEHREDMRENQRGHWGAKAADPARVVQGDDADHGKEDEVITGNHPRDACEICGAITLLETVIGCFVRSWV